MTCAGFEGCWILCFKGSFHRAGDDYTWGRINKCVFNTFSSSTPLKSVGRCGIFLRYHYQNEQHEKSIDCLAYCSLESLVRESIINREGDGPMNLGD